MPVLPRRPLLPAAEIRASMGLSVRKRKKEVDAKDYGKAIVPVEAAGVTAEDYVAGLDPDAPVFLNNAST